MTFQNALCKHVVLLEIKVYKTKSTEIAGNNDFFSCLTRTFFPTCIMHKTFVVWSFMILYYFLFLMRVYPSTNLWNFYTNNRLFIPLQYTTWLKSPRRPPIWYTYLVKGTFICRAMEHGILELHRCRIWYAYV
jgi:myo-inositol-1-phosphate synthase